MKNIHPLDVIPILGSGPSSPTSLKIKFKGRGGRSIEMPFEFVTNIPVFISLLSMIFLFPSSTCKHPESVTRHIIILTRNALTGAFTILPSNKNMLLFPI